MKLRDTICFDNFDSIFEIFVTFARESYDKICSDIELYPVFTLERSKLREYLTKEVSIIVPIHRTEYLRGSRLDREVNVCIDSTIFK